MRGSGRRRISRITLADRARDAQQWDLAIEHYRAALARNPFNPPIWVQFGNVLKEAGHYARAEGAYRAALEDDPGGADTYLQLGHLFKVQGRRDEADESYRRALALDPTAEAARHELAGADLHRRTARPPPVAYPRARQSTKSALGIGDAPGKPKTRRDESELVR